MISVREKILSSIKYVRDTIGYTLVFGEWGSSNSKCACAIGCVLLENDPKQIDFLDLHYRASKILNVSELWIVSFINGFDGIGNGRETAVPKAWKMGYSIATETKPIAYTTFVDGD